jgi:hypothetical protein
MKLKLVRKRVSSLSFLIVLAVILFISGCVSQNEGNVISIKIPELEDAIVGVPYNYSFATGMDPSGGSPPYTYYLGSGVGFPPMGLVMDLNGLLSGTPQTEGVSEFQVCVKDMGGNQACKMVSLTVKPASELTSIYEGTYKGTFNYKYRDAYFVSGSDEEQYTPWTSESFELTVTFKTLIMPDSPNDPTEKVSLDVTNAISSDPNFGTGSSGVNPLGNFGYETSAYLPVDPSQYGADEYTYLTLAFPNNARIEIRSNKDNNGNYAMIVSPDGNTLSSNPDWVNPIQNPGNPGYAWEAETPQGPLWDGTPTAETGVWMTRHYAFESWSLTKISS